MNLLGGFAAPSAGTVRAAGRRLADLREPSWQRQVLYIQDTYLFHATLRDDIVFYRFDADDDEVARAVEVVGRAILVAELRTGWNTLVVGEAPALSGGQAQRIALAAFWTTRGASHSIRRTRRTSTSRPSSRS